MERWSFLGDTTNLMHSALHSNKWNLNSLRLVGRFVSVAYMSSVFKSDMRIAAVIREEIVTLSAIYDWNNQHLILQRESTNKMLQNSQILMISA